MDAKRRKVRKGTHSCWECKRRKMKCILDPSSNETTCIGCRRRGSKCIGQEFSEDGTEKSHHGRTPATPGEDTRAGYGIISPASTESETSRYLAFYQSFEHRANENGHPNPTASSDKYERLSRFLYDSLPSRDDIEKIFEASRYIPTLTHELLTVSYTSLSQDGLKTPGSLLNTPEPKTHPVLIARYMLKLVVFLQHVHRDLREEIKGLSESSRAIMERLAYFAIGLVTTKDELLGSIEGLECVMIEGLYQANLGNLRRSWVAGRRAMGIAQLMGFNRSDNRAQVLDPSTKNDPQLMWFRIVALDRQLCLMMGLPEGCLDRTMASDAILAKDTPMGRLERIHCVVASRILERNESSPSSHNIALTQSIDIELQRAARSLPSKWWLAPNLDISTDDPQALFWDTRRLFTQVIHYNLLNQLHLPYMLHCASDDRRHEYSRMTCVNASREVLSRFIRLHGFHRIAYSCRTIDFLALMAGMTLIFAHLDCHRHSGGENLVAHQYHSDRGMIEQAQENMKEVSRLNSDALSAQSADLLGRLLSIEVETADGYSPGAERVSVQEVGSEAALSDQDDDGVVSVHIPYFGIVKVAREGMTKEVHKPHAPRPSLGVDKPGATDPGHTEPHSRLPGFTGAVGHNSFSTMTPVDGGYSQVSVPPTMSQHTYAGDGTLDSAESATHFAPQFQGGFSGRHAQYEEYPGLTAGGEDWAFQGVDMAFFESLMRSEGGC